MAASLRVRVEPDLLRWARERSGTDSEALAHRFPKLADWERGETKPTLKQIESFAKATHTPVGYFFLPQPPVERVPIPDFRTVANRRIGRPSPDLLETVYICQQRQEWYRDYARAMGEDRLTFVGSARVGASIEATATAMRRALGFDLAERRRFPTWIEALRRFIEQADALGVLVMVSGVVGSNNRRRLDADEFRGFALADDLAPLIFINGADTKAAQMFTLAHELAHIWLGQTALSDTTAISPEAAAGAALRDADRIEIWCNRLAAELLVPLAALSDEYEGSAELKDEMQRLARHFKVSTLVILRRLHDAGRLTRQALWRAYAEELETLKAIPRGDGGDFYLTQAARVGKRFARALVVSTLEGQTLHRDAFRLLGISKISTFRELGHSLGVA
jgi:Zn-dependent peptidase ImmA (M78 family)